MRLWGSCNQKVHRKVHVIRARMNISGLVSLPLLSSFHLYWLQLGRYFPYNSKTAPNGSRLVCYHLNNTCGKGASLFQEVLKLRNWISWNGCSVPCPSLNQPLWPRERDKPHGLRAGKRPVLQKKIRMLLSEEEIDT